ncbi:hypothetical protein [Labilibaculum euxinus]
MKTSKLYFFALAFTALSISMVSCSGDDGEAGLLGPKGDEGEQGVAGEVGPAGADGSIIYSGEGEPEAAVGTISDYYIDVVTGMLYGPKLNADNWIDVDGFSLKGTNGTNGSNGQDGANGADGTAGANGQDGVNGIDGQDGANGSKILSGEGDPEVEDGEKGDFYLNTTSFTLYGPKIDSGWSAGLMLKGADGNANVRTFRITLLKDDWQTFSDSRRNRLWRHLEIPAFTEDIFDNGIVLVNYKSSHENRLHQLPVSYVTNSGNHFKHSFYITSKTYDDGYIYNAISIEQCIYLTSDDTETLYKGDEVYHIKIITGKIAEQLSKNKDNQEEFNKLIKSLEIE